MMNEFFRELFAALMVLAVLGIVAIPMVYVLVWLIKKLWKLMVGFRIFTYSIGFVVCIVLVWAYWAAIDRQPRDDETWVMASAGLMSTYAVRSDNSLWAWGSNRGGRLGGRAMISRARPLKIMDDVAYVYATGSSAMVIKTDDSLWQLGSDGENHKILEDVRATSSSFAITNDGGLWEWRFGNRRTPTRIMDDVSAISSRSVHTMVVKNDGSLWELGRSSWHEDGTIDRLGAQTWIMDDVAYVSTGVNHRTVVLKTDGSLWTWTSTAMGREFVKIMDDVAAVSAGFGATMAIKTDGSLWAWGGNWSGHLGVGIRGRDAVIREPAMVMENVAYVSMGGIGARGADRAHTVAVGTDGSLWTWGDNRRGQLGTGTWMPRRTPVRISG